jgi:hypothetical protein
MAAEVLHNLGEKASVKEVLSKYDETFGNVKSLQALTTQFYTSHQLSTESVTQWGCRLEDIQRQIGDKQKMRETEKNEMLRDRFWFGLRCEEVKAAIRHHYDNLKQYSELLTAARMVEDEWSSKTRGAAVVASTVVSAAASGSSIEDKLEKLLKQMEVQDKKMSALQDKVDKFEGQHHSVPNEFDRTSSNRGRGNLTGRTARWQAGNRQCYKCGQWGHIKRDCPLNGYQPLL